MAAIFDLNHHAHYVHWHFITISISNIVVGVVMLLLFGLAIWLRLPGHDTPEENV